MSAIDEEAVPASLAVADSPRARLVGIALMSVALILFTVQGTTVKWLNTTIHPVQIAWVRYAGQFALYFVFVNPRSRPGIWRTQRLWLQLLRPTFLVGTTVGSFFALRYLQLDQTMAIAFSTPLFVALLAGPLLKERLGAHRWIAVLIGFVGILVIVRPTMNGLHPAVIASLLGSLCYGLYNICSRKLAATDSTATTMFYSSFVGVILLSLPLPWFWTTPTEPGVIGNLLVLGAYGGTGHLLLTMAHRRAQASLLAPFLYSQMIWVIFAGWLVFGQTPETATLIGAGIVILSGLYLLYREHVRHQSRSMEASVGD